MTYGIGPESPGLQDELEKRQGALVACINELGRIPAQNTDILISTGHKILCQKTPPPGDQRTISDSFIDIAGQAILEPHVTGLAGILLVRNEINAQRKRHEKNIHLGVISPEMLDIDAITRAILKLSGADDSVVVHIHDLKKYAPNETEADTFPLNAATYYWREIE